MAVPGSYSNYKTNVGRSVTKKWREANQINYDGDDWGDDDDDDNDAGYPEPVPTAATARQAPWSVPAPRPSSPYAASNRSVTNPSPARTAGRASFDRADDRRVLSSSAAGFESAYPTTQRSPFPEPQHPFDPSLPMPMYRDQPPLRVNTQPQLGFRPGSRGRQYPPYQDAPFSAPGAYPPPQQQQRRSGSSNRPPPPDLYQQQRRESPMRPDSRASNASGRHFPPRKQSLGQQSVPVDLPYADDAASISSAPPPPPPTMPDSRPVDDRPIPILPRPSDIYKRIPQEVEKARRSQDSSSRPSIDFAAPLAPSPQLHAPPPAHLPQLTTPAGQAARVSPPQLNAPALASARVSPPQLHPPLATSPQLPDSSSSAPKPPQDVSPPASDSDSSSRRLKPTLDPVPERKSEYGFDDLLKTAASPTEAGTDVGTGPGVSRQTTYASSVYTNRTDPVSATSTSRNLSLRDPAQEHDEPSPSSATATEARSNFVLPSIGRMSGFGLDWPSSPTADISPQTQQHAGPPSNAPTNVPTSAPTSAPTDTSLGVPPHAPSGAPDAQGLHHQPSLGYRSMVQRAFEESENQYSLTPTSASGTVGRSNSNSTADISPIIARRPDAASTAAPMATTATAPVPVAQPVPASMPEESTKSASRPASTTTLKPNDSHTTDSETVAAPAVQPPYRRDVTPPQRENSPAKRPVSVDTNVHLPPQQGSLVREDLECGSSRSPDRGRSLEEKPLPAAPVHPFASVAPAPRDEPSSIVPSPERTMSEEWQAWQAEKREFNAHAGLQDSSAPTPEGPSPAPDRGPPSVKESGETSDARSAEPTQPAQPAHATPNPEPDSASSRALEPPRPAPQPRLESFRPSIPGGWQSYSSREPSPADSPGAPGSQDLPKPPLGEPTAHAPPPIASLRQDSEESIPTARAPPDMESHRGGVSHNVSTAAALGALAGGLVGRESVQASQTRDAQTPNHGSDDDSSENELDTSSVESRERQANQPAMPNKGVADDHDQEPTSKQPALGQVAKPSEHPPQESGTKQPGLASVTVPSIIARPPTDEPPASPAAPPSATAPSEKNRAPPDLDDVPAPLRTSRMSESAGRPSIPDIYTSPASPTERDHERLQLEIVNSLQSPITAAKASSPTGPAPPATSLATSRKLPATVADSPQPRPPQSDAVLPQATFQAPLGAGSNLDGAARSTPPSNPGHTAATRPFLQQRFSWETSSEAPEPVPVSTPPRQRTPPSTGSPDTIRATDQSTPTAGGRRRDSDLPQALERQSTIPDRPAAVPPATQPLTKTPTKTSSNDVPNLHVSQPPPSDSVSFRSIMSLQTPQERIRAFNDNRRLHAAPNPELQHWIMSLHTAEHADLFAKNGVLPQDPAESPIPHKPSPRRILTESAGARHMQEDGKKLMAAAGRFGGKAGIAAKGLFAKGKGKMRSASSSEKGLMASRRKSTGADPAPDDGPPATASSRDSAFLHDAPQIPLTLSPMSRSGSDWFSKSRESDLFKTSVPTSQSASTVSGNDDRHDPSLREVVSHDTRGATVVGAATVVPSSPTISAVSADHRDRDRDRDRDDASVPSRSVSQVTRPTAEFPPAEPERDASAPQSVSSAAPDRQPPSSANDAVLLTAATTAATAAPRADGRSLAPTDQRNPLTQPPDVSLGVPGRGRVSISSSVSGVSPISGQHQSESPRRQSLSSASDSHRDLGGPPLHDTRRTTSPDLSPEPGFTGGPVAPATAVVPRLSQEHGSSTIIDGPIARPAGVEPVAAVAVPDERRESVSGPRSSYQSREGADTRFPFRDDKLTKEPTLSPVSQTLSNPALSKEESEVSVDQALDDSEVARHRQSRSYSRPFGIDPNMASHPAFRSPEPTQPLDRTQMYSSESPLPSARRPPEELSRLREQKEQQPQDSLPQSEASAESSYRIPGPYVQEYRSPKQITTPVTGRSQSQVAASGQQLPSARRSQNYSPQPAIQPAPVVPQPSRLSYVDHQHYYHQGYPDPGENRPPSSRPQSRQPSLVSSVPGPRNQQHETLYQAQWQPMGPPPRPVPVAVPATAPLPTTSPSPVEPRAKKGAFGALFGSKARSKLQKREASAVPMDEPQGPRKEKRASLFLRNSRRDSMSSQTSSVHDRHDQLGQLPPTSSSAQAARRPSRDLFRSSTADQPADGKKKRFSGLGSRLFKSGATNKTASDPAPPRNAASNADPQQYPSRTMLSPQPYSAQPFSAQQPYSAQPNSAQQPYSAQYSAQPNSAQQPYSEQSNYGASSLAAAPYIYQPGHHEPHEPSPHLPSSQDQRPRDHITRYPSLLHNPSGPNDYEHTSAHPPRLDQDQGLGDRGFHPPEPGQSKTPPYQGHDPRRPSDLRIDTSRGNITAMGQATTAPAQIYPPFDQSFRHSTSTHGDQHIGPPTGNINNSAPPRASVTTATDPRGSRFDPHVVDLHKRSRSPRLHGRASSEDLDVPGARQQPGDRQGSGSSHVNDLGTFSAKKISPVGGVPRAEGDQERPFAIGIPGLDEEDAQKSRQKGRLEGSGRGPGRSNTPVSQESGDAPADPGGGAGGVDRSVSVLDGMRGDTPAERRQSAVDKTMPKGIVAELPGSKAEGYESEEEIPMSATAYPGQEWMPIIVGDDRWDD